MCKSKKDDSLSKFLILGLLNSNSSSSSSGQTPTTTSTGSESSIFSVNDISRLRLPDGLVLVASKTASASAKLMEKSLNSQDSTISKEENLYRVVSKNSPQSKSHYETDKTQIYVNDPIKSSAGMFESMLKYVSNTGYAEFIDQGPKRVIIDDPLSSGSSNSVSNKLTLIVEASSTNGFTPVTVKVWGDLPPNQYMTDQKLLIIATIREGATDSNPTGDYDVKMTNSYKSSGNPNSSTFLISTVKTADQSKQFSALGSFKSVYGSNVTEGKAAFKVNLDSSGKSGTAAMKFVVSGTQSYTSESKMAWNDDVIYSYSTSPYGTNESGSDRNTSQKVVYSYGLYEKSTGNRKNLKVSFPIQRINDNADGYASEWGISLWNYSSTSPSSLPVIDGDIVKEKRYDGTEGTRYTVQKLKGSLSKITRVTYTLDEIKNINLNHTIFSGSTQTTNTISIASPTSIVWKKSCVITTSPSYSSTCTTKNNEEYSNTFYNSNNGYKSGYAYFPDGSGKSIFVSMDPSGNMTITGSLYESLSNLPSTLTLYEYNISNCYSSYTSASTGKTTLTISPNDMALKNGTADVTSYKWGLIDTNLTFSNISDCNQIYNQNITYSWNPSSGSMSRTRLKNLNGDVFQFDKPLNFPYKDSTGLYDLNYYSFGGGLSPWITVDSDSNYSNMGTMRPAVTVPNGTELTAGGVTYLVKQLYGSEYLKNIPVSSIPSSLKNAQFPSLEVPTSMEEVSIGATPTVISNPISVVKGRVSDK
jgi:hypothetical protein